MTKSRVQFNIPGHIHELTFSCYKNRAFLSDEVHCQYLAEAISKANNTLAYALLAYVFMPTHVHLLVQPQTESYQVSQYLQQVKQSVSRRALNHARKYNPTHLEMYRSNSKDRPYHFWQEGGGYDRNIITHLVIEKSINYIHNNPVRAGLVTKAEQWHWSSYKDWAGVGKGPIDIDTSPLI